MAAPMLPASPSSTMTLLIDTAAVPARDRVDFWSASSFDAYLPVQIRSSGQGRVRGPDVGLRGSARSSLFRIAAAANTMIRTSRAIAACDPECLHVSVVLRGQINAAQEGRTGVAGIGDVISYETSHPVVFRADQPFETLVVRVPRELLGRQATQISNLTAVGISGSEGLPRAAVAFVRGLVGGLEDGTITPTDAPNTVDCVLDLIRGLYATPAGALEPTRLRSRAEILLNVQSFIEANLGDPASRPRGDRPGELHLDPVPAQALRGRGHERLPLDSQRRGSSAAGATCSIRRWPTRRSSRSRAAGACPARSTSAACSGRRTAARRSELRREAKSLVVPPASTG